MSILFSQRDDRWTDDWNPNDWEILTVEESETIDLDYYGLTDDEIEAFNRIRKELYTESWLEYVSDWD